MTDRDTTKRWMIPAVRDTIPISSPTSLVSVGGRHRDSGANSVEKSQRKVDLVLLLNSVRVLSAVIRLSTPT